ncbi:MAG TPA: hypothetical protein VF169_01100 [Albitalea sp.]|uniref:hypothetical protein n=1 Tax=Piscinibacter sp. TaxID=1903157 RepID=UPI002ED4D84F
MAGIAAKSVVSSPIGKKALETGKDIATEVVKGAGAQILGTGVEALMSAAPKTSSPTSASGRPRLTLDTGLAQKFGELGKTPSSPTGGKGDLIDFSASTPKSPNSSAASDLAGLQFGASTRTPPPSYPSSPVGDHLMDSQPHEMRNLPTPPLTPNVHAPTGQNNGFFGQPVHADSRAMPYVGVQTQMHSPHGHFGVQTQANNHGNHGFPGGPGGPGFPGGHVLPGGSGFPGGGGDPGGPGHNAANGLAAGWQNAQATRWALDQQAQIQDYEKASIADAQSKASIRNVVSDILEGVFKESAKSGKKVNDITSGG